MYLVRGNFDLPEDTLCMTLTDLINKSRGWGDRLAQVVEYQTTTWEVSGLNPPTGPTLRLFKQLRRKCCLCNDICKWLAVLVFSDKDDKPEVPSPAPSLSCLAGDIKEPTYTLFQKTRTWSSRCCCLVLHSTCHGLGGKQRDQKCTESGSQRRLAYADVRSHCIKCVKRHETF